MGVPDARRQSAETPGTSVLLWVAPCSLLRLNGLRFSLDEESEVTFVDALHRVRTVLDVSPELNLFARRAWYAERSDELAMAMVKGEPEAFSKFILLLGLSHATSRRDSNGRMAWTRMTPSRSA